MERNRLLGYLIMMFILPAILDQVVSADLLLYCPLDTTVFNSDFIITYSETLAGYCPLDTTGFNSDFIITYSETLAGYCPLDVTIFN